MVLQLKQKPNYYHGFFCYRKRLAIILLDRKCCPSWHTWRSHAKFGDMLNSVQIKKKDLDCALLKRLSNCHCWILYRHSKILYWKYWTIGFFVIDNTHPHIKTDFAPNVIRSTTVSVVPYSKCTIKAGN